jgi:hypothetical protein
VVDGLLLRKKRYGMSELNSETHNRTLGLTVRVKLVDLNHTGNPSDASPKVRSAEHLSRERSGSIVGIIAERPGRNQSVEAEPAKSAGISGGEICMLSGARIASADFESHIEECPVCANRVDLQLDFMNTLEVAVYQRRAEPDSQKVHGAMLVSAPELNFAICGEIEAC